MKILIINTVLYIVLPLHDGPKCVLDYVSEFQADQMLQCLFAYVDAPYEQGLSSRTRVMHFDSSHVLVTTQCSWFKDIVKEDEG